MSGLSGFVRRYEVSSYRRESGKTRLSGRW
jgi:hypothetical protein